MWNLSKILTDFDKFGSNSTYFSIDEKMLRCKSKNILFLGDFLDFSVKDFGFLGDFFGFLSVFFRFTYCCMSQSQAGPKGRQLEVWPQWAPRLLVYYIHLLPEDQLLTFNDQMVSLFCLLNKSGHFLRWGMWFKGGGYANLT